MLQAVLKQEKKKKLHSVVKKSRKFKFQLNMTQKKKLIPILNQQKQLKIYRKKLKMVAQKTRKKDGEKNYYMESTP